MKHFVVVTPTYQRARTLERLYRSLCAQTITSFTWLVIDDGSTDGTRELIQKFQTEGLLDIEYHYKKNGGKHTAMREALRYISSDQYLYFYAIDSDDALVPNALEILEKHWNDIEKNENTDVKLIKARTRKAHEVTPPYHPMYEGKPYVEATYQEVTYKMHNKYEMSTSLRVCDLSTLFHIPETFWLCDKVKFFSEGIIWARDGRLAKTRYIPEPIRIFYEDAEVRLTTLRKTGNRDYLYNYIVGIRYGLSENFADRMRWEPMSVLKGVVLYCGMTSIVGISFKEAFRELSHPVLKVLFVSFYPMVPFVRLCYKIKRS